MVGIKIATNKQIQILKYRSKFQFFSLLKQSKPWIFAIIQKKAFYLIYNIFRPNSIFFFIFLVKKVKSKTSVTISKF